MLLLLTFLEDTEGLTRKILPKNIFWIEDIPQFVTGEAM